jgi:hypothetical protein
MSEYKMGGNCPRCKKDYPDYPALSRFDNKTDICSACGRQEALFNFANPGKPLPPVDRPVA